MPPRLLFGVVLAAAALVAGAACGADADDGGRSASSLAPIDACAATVDPPTSGAVLVPGALDVTIGGGVAFVPGDGDGDGTAGAGHGHAGGAVEPGDPHLHYCLVLDNGGGDPVTIDAVQVLPADGEEPLAVFEADTLTEASGRSGTAPVPVAPGARLDLELLVPADTPTDALRHRVAYTVQASGGPQDRFEEIAFVDLEGADAG